jgi:hypothetical protein
MNFLWHPVYPNLVWNCLTDVGGWKYKITSVFVGSTINPCLHTISLNNIPNSAQKKHFFRFKDIWCCLCLYNVKLRNSMWYISKLNTFQSSKYASRNFGINYVNKARTTLENIAGALFNPNDITVYWRFPHSIANVVLCMSSYKIIIWFYLEEP